MIFTSWVAYLSFAFIVFLIIPTARLAPVARWGILLAALLIGAVPLPGGMPLAGYVRAVTDDLAITTLALLGAATLQRLGWLGSPRSWHQLQTYLLFVIAGVVLYPAALGMSMFDPYRWGYTPMILIGVTGAIALAMVCLENRRLAVVLSLATVAFALQLKASPNYWDYIVDPLLVLFAVVATARWMALRLTGRHATA
ncbi:hypothetical protein KEM63_04180 [Halopseudomonas nanhaiensis]|uniref:hypothetical protein n=1 Tax=Halopseudomonas nanhaiensis TaxID=2830842 RepID=UPI001CBAE4CD|nr:hypothetical protein [Halopseudomonas nanhaiensis]UAW99178.1 hypothetical protein KEM63_04180 [Halopseudomonas nanhaiensis]